MMGVRVCPATEVRAMEASVRRGGAAQRDPHDDRDNVAPQDAGRSTHVSNRSARSVPHGNRAARRPARSLCQATVAYGVARLCSRICAP